MRYTRLIKEAKEGTNCRRRAGGCEDARQRASPCLEPNSSIFSFTVGLDGSLRGGQQLAGRILLPCLSPPSSTISARGGGEGQLALPVFTLILETCPGVVAF